MNFRTELKANKTHLTIDHHTPILFLGSCFSQNIGLKLQKYKFNCRINPFGTIFNPISIAYLLKRSVDCQYEEEESLILSQGLWVHPNYHSQLSNVSRAEALNLINTQIHSNHIYLKSCKFLFLTLGTSIAYQMKETNNVVANCHKVPSFQFEKLNLNVTEILLELKTALKALWILNPDIKVVFTVSPVRHIKDGIVENSFSKAKLHIVIDELKKFDTKISYFPAYEWVMDDLRDYRYYEDDLIHPSIFSINYIWSKYLMCFVGEKTLEIINQLEKIFNDENHRPFHESSNEHKLFIKSLNLKKEQFIEKYPFLDL